MSKIHIHKDTIVRIQSDLFRKEFGWLYGSIVSRNDGKHIYIKEYTHNYMSDRSILGWYYVDYAHNWNEDKVKQYFREIHMFMMKQFISQNGQDDKIQKQFGSLIGLSVSLEVSTERKNQPAQIFKNQIRVYSVYTPESYMQVLFENALQSDTKPFYYNLSLRRDLSLIIHSGQMSQFFMRARQMNLEETLSDPGYFDSQVESSMVESFSGNFFNIERVEQFCENALNSHNKLLDEYEKVYKENQLLRAQLWLYTKCERDVRQRIKQQRDSNPHSTQQQQQQSSSSSASSSGGLTQQILLNGSVVNK